MSSDSNKKYKKPKQKTLSTTKPEATPNKVKSDIDVKPSEPVCPLLAKDSEWVDILQTPLPEAGSASNISEEEEVLQLVECEDGPQMKPLAILFPGLLEKDPQTLQGMLNKAMSTTEVTRHLVDLGQKANFTFMKKANRLIPRDKQWMESLTENSNSFSSMGSEMFSGSMSSEYDLDEISELKKLKASTTQKKVETPVNSPVKIKPKEPPNKTDNPAPGPVSEAIVRKEIPIKIDAKIDYNYDADIDTDALTDAKENIRKK